MRFHTLLASSLVALVAVSCNENSQPPAQTNNTSAVSAVRDPGPQAQPQRQNAAVVQAPGHLQTASQQPQSFQNVTPPADAKWTIWCDKVDGPAHVAQASMIKSRLIQSTGMKDWYVVHTETDSSLYYGYYSDSPSDKKRADADRARIVALTDVRGNQLIRGSVLVAIAPPDPIAPKEWNLLNTPPDTYWTIEVMTFVGNPKRKEAAVEAVRALRAEGKPAYYYHGETASSVCIGAWKRAAVTEQGTVYNKEGITRDDAHTQSADTPLLVFGNIVPPNVPRKVLEPETGKPMAVMAPKLEIVDPQMKAAAAEFPYHMVNYEYRGTQSGDKPDYDPSVLVAIPHDQSLASEDDWRMGGASAPAPGEVQRRQTPTAAGDSVLRSLGDH